jgi:hypothetical protein
LFEAGIRGKCKSFRFREIEHACKVLCECGRKTVLGVCKSIDVVGQIIMEEMVYIANADP